MLKIIVPTKYLCPITKQIMLRPVTAADGYTYEYDTIATWLEGQEKSPITHKRLNNKSLVPNKTLESEISEFSRTNAPCPREELLRTCAGDDKAAIMKLRFLNCHMETHDDNGDTPLLAAITRIAAKASLSSTPIDSKTEAKITVADIATTPHTHLSISAQVDDVKSSTNVAALNTVQFLINDVAVSIETKSKNGESPIHRAIQVGSLESVMLLIEKGANLGVTRESDYTTPLILAVKTGNERIVRCLLENHALLHAKDRRGQNALSWACKLGHANIVSLLLAAERAGKNEQQTRATSSLTVESLRMQPPRSGCQTLEQQNTLHRLQQALTEMGIMDGGGTLPDHRPMHYAARNGFNRIVNLLVAAGYDVNITDPRNGNTPLMEAARHDHVKTVHRLALAKARLTDRNYRQETALHGAVTNRHYLVVNKLIQLETEPEIIAVLDTESSTPDPLGQRESDSKSTNSTITTITRFYSLQLNIADRRGNTPLHQACKVGDSKSVSLLLNAGVKLEPPNNEGATPLSLAVYGMHFDTAKILLSNNIAQLEQLNKEGETPLMWLSKFDKPESVDFLLRLGSDIRQKNSRNRMALHVALAHNHPNVILRIISAHIVHPQKTTKTIPKSVTKSADVGIGISSTQTGLKFDAKASFSSILDRSTSTIIPEDKTIILDFSNCHLTDDDIAKLLPYLKNNGLKYNLNLSNNQLTKHCAASLIDFLRENHNIVELNLSNNSIGGASTFSNSAIYQLTNALSHNIHLKSLNLENTDLTDRDLTAILNVAFKHPLLRKINIDKNPNISPTLRERVAKLAATPVAKFEMEEKMLEGDETKRLSIEPLDYKDVHELLVELKSIQEELRQKQDFGHTPSKTLRARVLSQDLETSVPTPGSDSEPQGGIDNLIGLQQELEKKDAEIAKLNKEVADSKAQLVSKNASASPAKAFIKAKIADEVQSSSRSGHEPTETLTFAT